MNISDFFFKLFKKHTYRYYVEVVRYWEAHSYDTSLKCMSYAHPVFIIKKRNLFKPDVVVQSFFYTNRIEEALTEVRKLNNSDYVANEKAYNEYDVEECWNTINPETLHTLEITNANSGVHVINK